MSSEQQKNPVETSGSETHKECQKILDKLNTEDLIYAVEQHSAIWDASSEDYSNKHVKLNAWNEIICTFLPAFEHLSLAERNNLMTLVQKKWKSIRACYTRELLRLKGVKSGSAATRKKQYTYFEQLRFLDPTVKKTTTNMDEGDITNEEENKTSIFFDSRPTCSNSQNRCKKRTSNNNELLKVLKKKIASEEKSRTFDETDEDKLFLLSMLTEFHKVPAENKLKLRADMISLVAAAQIPVLQGWQYVGYPGHSNHVPPPSMLKYPMQIQHMQQHLMEQHRTMCLQSPPSAATSDTSNEDSDTQMSESLLFNT